MAIYFVRCNQFVKIGYSSEPKERVWTLQTATPYKINILFFMPGDRWLEKDLHNRFGEYQHKGEWYKPEGRLLTFIKVNMPIYFRFTSRKLRKKTRDAGDFVTQEKVQEVAPQKIKMNKVGDPYRTLSNGSRLREIINELLNWTDESSFPLGAYVLTKGEVAAIELLHNHGASKNLTCKIVFGSKNSPRMTAISNVCRGI